MNRSFIFLFVIILFFPAAAQSFTEHAQSYGTGTAAFLHSHPDYTVSADNGSLALLINKENCAVAVVNARTGTVLAGSVMNGQQGNDTVKNMQKSDIQVSYLADTGNKKIGTLHTMDSYSFCTLLNGFEVRDIPQGFELDMTLGSTVLTVDDLPKMIPIHKYNELLLPYFSSKNDKQFRDNYRMINDTQWIRVKDKDMGDMILAYLHDLLFEKSKYTQEDLIADNAAFGYVPVTTNPRISLTMRYVLEGDDVVVTIPLSGMEGNRQVQMLEAAPYFLSAGTEDSGYLFVPDGSGGLIHFNNGKMSAPAYQAQVFGSDILKDSYIYKTSTVPITLPVYGIKKNAGAVLAIIERGAELAEIFADVSGHADEFNRVSSRFILRDIENISLAGNASITTARWPEDVYTGDIVIRYKFLSGDAACYTGMAKHYQQYLLNRNGLKKHTPEPQAPFFAECLGALRKLKFFLGVGYHATVCATTIPQGEEIYRTLHANGVGTIKFLFSGLYAGGIKHESLKKIRLDSGIGSAQDLAHLQKTAAETGGTVFPSIYLGNVFGTKRFNKLSDAPRRQNGKPAGAVIFLENTMLSRNLAYPAYYVSPYVLSSYTETVKQNLTAWNIGGLAIRDLGNTLIPDYRRKKHLSRIHAAPIFQAALDSLAGSYQLIVHNPNSYALAAASYITGLPSSHNGYAIFDEAVPFIQLVLEGCIPYTSTAWNGKAVIGLKHAFLHAIETKSSPYFVFTYQKETVFHNILDIDLAETFSTYYADWTTTAAALYKEYNDFYLKVKDATITAHDTLSDQVRRVVYTNGITVYVNYGAQAWQQNGLHVPAHSYLLQ